MASSAKNNLVVIEGIIGAGKSTAIKSLPNNIEKYLEPLHNKLDQFTFYNYSTNVFSELYGCNNQTEQNKLNSCASIQALIIETFCDFYKNHIKWTGTNLIVTERSWDSSKYFLEALYEYKAITKFDYMYLSRKLELQNAKILTIVEHITKKTISDNSYDCH